MNIIYKYIILFFIYSVLGWITESIYTSINQKKIVDRGFLIGPYCPIYGCGAIIGIIYLTQYKDNMLTVFFLGVIIASIIEYLTSYLMEKIFKVRWWDYSEKKFNLNGRICGTNAILFGICSIIVIYLTEPSLEILLSKLNNNILLILSLIIIIIITTDTIISCNIIKNLKNNLSKIEIKKDATNEIKALVLDYLNNITINGKQKKNTLQKRIIKAYPNIDLKRLIKIRNDKLTELKRLFTKK